MPHLFYPGEVARPTVQYDLINQGAQVLVSSVWGAKQSQNILLDCANTFAEEIGTNTEVTLPPGEGFVLNFEGKKLKNIFLKANIEIYEKQNKPEYSSACEAALFSVTNQTLNWVQVGQPHILLWRDNKLHYLHTARDFSLDFKMPSPLPYELLGVQRSPELTFNTFSINEGDRFFLFTGAVVPNCFFTGKINALESLLTDLSKMAIEEAPEKSFGLAELILK